MSSMAPGGTCGGLVAGSVGASVVDSSLSWLADEDDDTGARRCVDLKSSYKSKESNILFFNILDKKNFIFESKVE